MNKWIKILLVVIFFAAISVALFLVFKTLGITNINTLRSIIEKCGVYAVVVYILISSTLLTTLCFVPIMDTSIIALAIIMFNPLTAFFACLSSMLISNTVLFFIGDKFGEKLAIKLISKEELEKAQNLVDKKSKIILPIAFAVPIVPDEALCIVAGMTKMKYIYLISVSAIFHAIEIGMLCFLGSGIINWAALSIIDWFVLINVIVIDIIILFTLKKKIN